MSPPPKQAPQVHRGVAAEDYLDDGRYRSMVEEALEVKDMGW